MFRADGTFGGDSSPMTMQSISAAAPSIYKEYFPQEEIVRINLQESQKPSGLKRRPIYFGIIHVRDGRESAVVKIEGHALSSAFVRRSPLFRRLADARSCGVFG